jgi:hypothetical protein
VMEDSLERVSANMATGNTYHFQGGKLLVASRTSNDPSSCPNCVSRIDHGAKAFVSAHLGLRAPSDRVFLHYCGNIEPSFIIHSVSRF